MTQIAINPGPAAVAPDAGHHAHPPHLAHHFDTPEQQFQSGKLGMWVFLATEILMFGGLFVAYSVYRHNHPDVFAYAHQYLDKLLGGVNTVVLITSSLTMAWGVRCAQLGQQRRLIACLVLTLLGGFGFMGIKSVEYHHKWEHHLWVGPQNKFRPTNGAAPLTVEEGHGESAAKQHADAHHAADVNIATLAHPPAGEPTATDAPAPVAGTTADPNAGTADEAKIRVPAAAAAPPAGLSASAVREHAMRYADLTRHDQSRVATFFSIYFVMTGLHGLHVVIGMALIFWILLRASTKRQAFWFRTAAPMSVGLFLIFVGLLVGSHGTVVAGAVLGAVGPVGAALAIYRYRKYPAGRGAEFGPEYFTPVDLVGLYWHLVDLIWIFLFPLLYLIH